MTTSESAVGDESAEPSPPPDDAAQKGPSTGRRMLHAMNPSVVLSKADSPVLRITLLLCYPVWVVLVLAAIVLYYTFLAVVVLLYLLWQGVVYAAKGLLIAVYVVGWVISWPVRAVLKKETPEEDKGAQESDREFAAGL